MLALGVIAPAGAAAGDLAVGITSGASPDVLLLDTDSPGAPLAQRPITGLGGDIIMGADLRPGTGQVYLFTDGNRLFILDAATGATFQQGANIDPTLLGSSVPGGFDFNPAADRLRLVNGAEDNLRWNPVTATAVDGDAGTGGIQPDTDLAYLVGDTNAAANPNVVASAYDRNDTDPTTATTLFAVDSTLDILVRQGAVDGNGSDVGGGGSPNGGRLATLGNLGLNVTDNVSMDGSGGRLLMVAQPQGAGASSLYRVNPGPAGPGDPIGHATLIGAIPGPLLTGFTVLPGGGFGFEATSTPVSEAGTEAVVAVSRTGDTLAPAQIAYETSSGTAVAGEDFTAVSGVLAFGQGERTKTVTVPLSGDAAVEGAETFVLGLSSPSAGALVLDPSHSIAIVDDDAEPGPTPPALQLLSSVSAPKSLKALSRAKRLDVRFACSTACDAAFVLSVGRKQVGSGAGSLAEAGVGDVRIALSKAGRKAIAKVLDRGKGGRAKLAVSGSATNAAGGSDSDSVSLKVPVR